MEASRCNAGFHCSELVPFPNRINRSSPWLDQVFS